MPSPTGGKEIEMGYEVESARVYAQGERYCTGSGLSVMTGNLAEADALYSGLVASPTYRAAVELREFVGDGTVRVLKRHGPSMADARRSMNRAYRLRCSEAA
jgi:hypothetical protein